ncbi:hypothetical protein TCDM_10654 [Trypanosoma cruzi Dm28c]|uniref:Uncharacterized protein n=1 Tax=Trypanosoma cruzi Dm28c TaxID=1416333 RepID=V5B2D7_TRYCR|nr:hypothetical protein TCDM_10654 [Trypanosoma cruzi Dm28c]
MRWAQFKNNQNNTKKERSSPCTVPHTPQSPLLLSFLRPSSTGLGIVRPSQHRQSITRSRCAATSATSQSNSSVSTTALTIAGMPRPHNTHSATMSCRLSSTIMSATPNAYWPTCSMRCNHPRIRLAVMHCSLLSSLLYLWHHNVVWPAASQCWKKYGAATVRVSVWL